MILYTLGCDNGHRFESWFGNSTGYDEQVASGHVSCPVCGSASIEKAIMAPALVSRSTDRGEKPLALAVAPEAKPAGGLLGEREAMMRSFLRTMREKILAEGQDVGRAFPEEARRMHEGDIAERPIRGQATPREARDLLEDGIMIMPVPVLPDELN